MTAPTPWHVRDEDLRGYADGSAPVSAAMSIESHVVVCDVCRERLADQVPAAPLEAIWTRIEDDVLTMPTPWAHHVLHRIGFTASDILLLGAAPALRAAWVLGTAVVLLFAVAAVAWSTDRSITAYLVVAPLAPVFGVAFAYGSDVDPTHELAIATPHSALRLLLVRTLAVTAFCLPLAAVAGLLLPGPPWLAVAWLLPAAAGVVLILAASTWVPTTRAAGVVAVAWTALVAVSVTRVSPLTLVEGHALISYAVALAIGLLIFRHRAHLLTRMEQR
ncbi:MAG: hypothetical protein ABJA74_07300 [Lapillicoccus sp.]